MKKLTFNDLAETLLLMGYKAILLNKAAAEIEIPDYMDKNELIDLVEKIKINYLKIEEV
jgi:hypothetical protein